MAMRDYFRGCAGVVCRACVENEVGWIFSCRRCARIVDVRLLLRASELDARVAVRCSMQRITSEHAVIRRVSTPKVGQIFLRLPFAGTRIHHFSIRQTIRSSVSRSKEQKNILPPSER